MRLLQAVSDRVFGLLDRFRPDRMSEADRARWAECRTLADLGELTAQWLEGRIARQPGYCGPVDVDEDMSPGLTGTLTALNRAGMVTNSSQAAYIGAGYDGAQWQQRAAVSGYASPATVERLRSALAGTGLRVDEAKARGWPAVVPVTAREGVVFTAFGGQIPESDLRDDWTGYGVCHPDAVEAVVGATQIVIYDPEWGRNDRLWPALRRAVAVEPVAAPATPGPRSPSINTCEAHTVGQLRAALEQAGNAVTLFTETAVAAQRDATTVLRRLEALTAAATVHNASPRVLGGIAEMSDQIQRVAETAAQLAVACTDLAVSTNQTIEALNATDGAIEEVAVSAGHIGDRRLYQN